MGRYEGSSKREFHSTKCLHKKKKSYRRFQINNDAAKTKIIGEETQFRSRQKLIKSIQRMNEMKDSSFGK